MKPLFISILLSCSAFPVQAQSGFLGETGEYSLTFLSITAVHIRVDVPEITTIEGVPAYHIVATARTSALFSPFYTLENRYETYIDTSTGLPLRYDKTIDQRTLTQSMRAVFDQSRHEAVYHGGKFDTTVRVPILPEAHNLFSMIFFLRKAPLKVGQTLDLNLDIETEPWKVHIAVVSEETLTVMGKPTRAFKVAFRFIPTREETRRKHTDVLTRRLVTSQTDLYYWIGAEKPFPFFQVEYQMSPFSTYTILTGLKHAH